MTIPSKPKDFSVTYGRGAATESVFYDSMTKAKNAAASRLESLKERAIRMANDTVGDIADGIEAIYSAADGEMIAVCVDRYSNAIVYMTFRDITKHETNEMRRAS